MGQGWWVGSKVWPKDGGQGGKGVLWQPAEKGGWEARLEQAGGSFLGVETLDRALMADSVVQLVKPSIGSNSGAAGSQKELGEEPRCVGGYQRGQGKLGEGTGVKIDTLID